MDVVRFEAPADGIAVFHAQYRCEESQGIQAVDAFKRFDGLTINVDGPLGRAIGLVDAGQVRDDFGWDARI
jgi:hypothetical protein